MTKRFFFTIMLFVFVFAMSACFDNGSKELFGAWKTIEKNKLSGKQDTLLIDEKTLTINAHLKVDIIFEKKDGKVLLRKAGTDITSCIVTIIDKNTIKVDRGILGERTYARTTPEELQRIAVSPGHVSKPDPF